MKTLFTLSLLVLPLTALAGGFDDGSVFGVYISPQPGSSPPDPFKIHREAFIGGDYTPSGSSFKAEKPVTKIAPSADQSINPIKIFRAKNAQEAAVAKLEEEAAQHSEIDMLRLRQLELRMEANQRLLSHPGTPKVFTADELKHLKALQVSLAKEHEELLAKISASSEMTALAQGIEDLSKITRRGYKVGGVYVAAGVGAAAVATYLASPGKDVIDSKNFSPKHEVAPSVAASDEPSTTNANTAQ